MAITLKVKADHYNGLLKSTCLNKLKLDKVDKFKSHKQADEYQSALFETVNKQDGYHAGINDAGLLEIIKEKTEKPKGKGKKSSSAKTKNSKKLEVKQDEQTTELINTVIKAEEYRGAKWYQTGQWLMAHKARFGKEAKGNREVAWEILSALSGGVNLPEKVEHWKSGEMVKLRNQSGKVQWSIWSMTRRWTQNIADIFAGIEAHGWDAMFKDGELVSRSDLSDLNKEKKADEKTPEAPIDTFKRNIDMAIKKLEECPGDKDGKAKVKELMAELNAAYAEWK